MMSLSIRPRYARLAVDDGQELTESNFHYAELDWTIPTKQAAVVCVDVWAWHYSRECLDRIDAIARGPIARLVAACRQYGLQLIHAPASPVAEKSPGWVKMMGDAQAQPAWPDSPVWPPPEFTKKADQYAQYARPRNAQQDMLDEHRVNKRWYHECCAPEEGEAVILGGEELHRLCAKRGILHLFYIGFNTNACMVMRDYGITAMIARGYHGILVRDATTGMEIADTLADFTCTRGAIASLEQFGAYTVSSDQLIEALKTQT